MQAILQRKVKREAKGAVREIRRDNAFIPKLEINNKIQTDMVPEEEGTRFLDLGTASVLEKSSKIKQN